MNSRHALALERQALVARSASQRSAIIEGTAPLLHHAQRLDRIVGTVRRHPLIAGLAVTGVALLGSRKLFDVATRLLTVYMLVRPR